MYSPVSSVRSVKVTFIPLGGVGRGDGKCLGPPLTLMFTSSLEVKGQGSSLDMMPIIVLLRESA